MRKQRTFGDLKSGSYFYTASPASIHRVKVLTVKREEPGFVNIGFSYYHPFQTANETCRKIENDTARIYWYVDKEDAMIKACELQEKAIQDMEKRIGFMRIELDMFKKKIKANDR